MPYQNYDCERFSDLKALLRAAASRYAEKPFLLEQSDARQPKLTYRRFAEDVEVIGCALSEAGLAGSHIAIIGESGRRWAQAFFGVVCSGGVAVPIDKELSPKAMAELIVQTDVRAVMVSDTCVEKLVGLDDSVIRITFSELEDWAEHGDYRIRRVKPKALDTCVLMPTGDESGARVAAKLSHANLCFAVSEISQMVAIDEKDLFFSVLPTYRIYGLVFGLLFPMSRGATIAFSNRLESMIDDMRAIRPTVLLGAPILLERIYRKVWENIRRQGIEAEISLAIKTTDAIAGEKSRMASKRNVLSQIHKIFGGELRLLLSGGEILEAEVTSGLRALGFATVQSFGVVECTGLIAMNRDLYYRDASVGLVTPNALLDICDEQDDGVGEIRVRGEQVTVGYYKAPELTKKRIRNGWFYTGTLGRLDNDGFLQVIGQKKNAIAVTGGRLVSPEKLEIQLRTIPLVRDVAVVGYSRPDGDGNDLVALIYAVEGDVEFELKKAIAEINALLPEDLRIRDFLTLDAPLPRTVNQKIRRVGLAESFESVYRRRQG